MVDKICLFDAIDLKILTCNNRCSCLTICIWTKNTFGVPQTHLMIPVHRTTHGPQNTRLCLGVGNLVNRDIPIIYLCMSCIIIHIN